MVSELKARATSLPGVQVRRATAKDAADIARIYNQGIEDRGSTFQTQLQPPDAFDARIAAGVVGVAEEDGEVVGAAWSSTYDAAYYYAGVREVTVYVDRAARRRGAGRALLGWLDAQARTDGAYKLVAKVFITNTASLALFGSCGWREVGTHERHGRIEGEWRDVKVLEKAL
jgi:phosphinothricin acetyltransferase